MIVYADSSFLISLYLIDSNYRAAKEWMEAAGVALPLTDFGAFEMRNAVRSTVIRRSVTEDKALHVLEEIDRDVANGTLLLTDCDWNEVYRTAEDLSASHTIAGGYRALDVLHVATALILETSDFLTFDQRQSQLAQEAGLVTHF